MIDKSTEDQFSDWEAHVFGFGYGDGQAHIIPALKSFLEAIPDEGGYKYYDLEAKLGDTVAWLLINILCKAHILEYGTSPRFAWLTPQGKALRDFVMGRDIGDLLKLTCRDENYWACAPDACNCGPHGYEAGRRCKNVFWTAAR